MNLSITDDITFRKLTIFMMLVEKGNIARTAEALHTLEENVRGPLVSSIKASSVLVPI